jgi:Ribbon-helix-helix protein, copG family
VKKTSIYIDPEVDFALGRRAAAQGTTKAALIRDALAQAAAPATAIKPRACGVFDGPGDLSENVDEYLARTGFGET